jgi:hypothetical protein
MTLQIQIQVTPNASKNQIVDDQNGLLRIRIKGAPEKGEVNKALIEYLAKELRVAKSRIELVSGHTSRYKKLNIDGITQQQFNEALGISEILLE